MTEINATSLFIEMYKIQADLLAIISTLKSELSENKKQRLEIIRQIYYYEILIEKATESNPDLSSHEGLKKIKHELSLLESELEKLKISEQIE